MPEKLSELSHTGRGPGRQSEISRHRHEQYDAQSDFPVLEQGEAAQRKLVPQVSRSSHRGLTDLERAENISRRAQGAGTGPPGNYEYWGFAGQDTASIRHKDMFDFVIVFAIN